MMTYQTPITLNSSRINSTVAPPWITHKDALLTWFTLSMLISTISAVANALLIVVVASNRSLRTGSNLLIGHLACVECLICAVHMPIHMTVTFLRQYGLAPDGCAASQTLLGSTFTCADWTLVYLAINRLVAIFLPHDYRKIVAPKAVFSGLAVCWVIALSLNLPFCFDIPNKFILGPPWYSCVVAPPRLGGYDFRVVYLAGTTYVPLAVVGSLYLAILVKSAFLYHHQQVQPAPSPGVAVQSQQSRTVQARATQWRRAHTACVLFASWFCYCLCFFSNTIIANFNAALIRDSPVLQLWTRTMYLVGYLIHPLFLFTMSSPHRAGLLTLLGYRSANRRVHA